VNEAARAAGNFTEERTVKNNGSSYSGGIGFGGLLTVAFIVLKLCHVIDWSWWWVLSPLWIGLGVLILVLGIILTVALIAAMVSK
jgi:phosphoglycerol transferase MdoB-like AlkP superfamily enzyme